MDVRPVTRLSRDAAGYCRERVVRTCRSPYLGRASSGWLHDRRLRSIAHRRPKVEPRWTRMGPGAYPVPQALRDLGDDLSDSATREMWWNLRRGDDLRRRLRRCHLPDGLRRAAGPARCGRIRHRRRTEGNLHPRRAERVGTGLAVQLCTGGWPLRSTSRACRISATCGTYWHRLPEAREHGQREGAAGPRCDPEPCLTCGRRVPLRLQAAIDGTDRPEAAVLRISAIAGPAAIPAPVDHLVPRCSHPIAGARERFHGPGWSPWSPWSPTVRCGARSRRTAR